MEYISISQFAQKYGISERTARNYCAKGKIAGAFLTGKTWNIPANSPKPDRKTKKNNISTTMHTKRTKGYQTKRWHLSPHPD